MTDVKRVRVLDLGLWPGNPRRGRKKLIRESLEQFGQTRPLHAMRNGTVFMGNNTLECMRDLGWTEADVVFHDIDEPTARRIMLMDNRTAELGIYDDEALAEVLESLDGNYAGTGWTSDDYDRLLEIVGESSRDEYWEAADDYDDAHVVEIEHVSSTGAAYAENPLAEAARRERQDQQVTHNIAGTRELVLVYPDGEHAEVMSMLDVLKTGKYEGMRVPQIVYRLLRKAVDGA